MTDKAVIFDMDGVLVDSYQPHLDSWNVILADYGQSMTVEQFEATFGQTSREIIRRFCPAITDPKKVDALDARKELAYRQTIAKNFPEMPGASALVRQLHDAGFALAIGSSGPRENVECILKYLPAGGLFDASVSGMDVHKGKPDPAIFLTAAKKLNTPPGRCVVIEDSTVGLNAARAAGMPAIALVGTHDKAPLQALADATVNSLDRITPAMIDKLIQNRASSRKPALEGNKK